MFLTVLTLIRVRTEIIDRATVQTQRFHSIAGTQYPAYTTDNFTAPLHPELSSAQGPTCPRLRRHANGRGRAAAP